MKREKLIRIITCTAAFFAVSTIPVLGADGWQQDSVHQWVYMENDKKLVNQWLPWTDGTMRYVGGNGQIVTDNWVTIGENRFRLWPDGTMRYVGDNGRIAADRWVNVGEARYRVRSDGSRYENEWFSLTSKPSLPSGNPGTTWYYAGVDGNILKNGWYDLNGKLYYFYPGGNSPRNSFFNLEDKRYYVDEMGARKNPGWFSIDNVNSKGISYTTWYYVTEDGFLLRDGWHELEGITCYFDTHVSASQNS